MKKVLHFMCSKCYSIYTKECEIGNTKQEDLNVNELTCECKHCHTKENMFICDSNLSANIHKLNKKKFFTIACCEGHYDKIDTTIQPYILFKYGVNINVIDYSKYKFWSAYTDKIIKDESIDKEELTDDDFVDCWILEVRKNESNEWYTLKSDEEKGQLYMYDDLNKKQFESMKHQWLCELNKIVKELCEYRKSQNPEFYKRPKLNREKIKENKRKQREEAKRLAMLKGVKYDKKRKV